MFFESASKASALFWQHFSEMGMLVAAFIVAAGLVGELPEAKTWRSWAFAALVTVGVIGELIADGFLYASSERLQELSDREIAAASTQADTAIERQKALQDLNDRLRRAVEAQGATITNAQSQISELTSKESALRAGLLTDEKARRAMLDQIKPRDLTKAQVAKIASLIRGHVGTVYLYALGDSDAMPFAYAIATALKAGGANVQLMLDTSKGDPPRFWERFGLPVSLNGVTLYEYPNGGKNGVGMTLLNAFAKAGIADGVLETPEKPFPDVPSPAIFVGLKSLPFQGFPAYAAPKTLEKWQKAHPPPWNPK